MKALNILLSDGGFRRSFIAVFFLLRDFFLVSNSFLSCNTDILSVFTLESFWSFDCAVCPPRTWYILSVILRGKVRLWMEYELGKYTSSNMIIKLLNEIIRNKRRVVTNLSYWLQTPNSILSWEVTDIYSINIPNFVTVFPKYVFISTLLHIPDAYYCWNISANCQNISRFESSLIIILLIAWFELSNLV